MRRRATQAACAGLSRDRHAVATHSAPEPTIAATPHRERLIAAMATSIEEKGFRDTTVADVVRIAHTSTAGPSTSTSRIVRACFLALFDAVNDATRHRIAAAVDPGRDPMGRAGRLVRSRPTSPGCHPRTRRSTQQLCPRAPGGWAAPALHRGLAVVERFARLLIGLVESGRAAQPDLDARPLSMDAAVMIVGGLARTRRDLAPARDVIYGELPASAGAMVKATLPGRCSSDGAPEFRVSIGYALCTKAGLGSPSMG